MYIRSVASVIMSWVITCRDSSCKDIGSLGVAALNVVHQLLVGKTEENYENQVGVAGYFTESRNTFHSVVLALVYSGVDRFYLCPERVKFVVDTPNRKSWL